MTKAVSVEVRYILRRDKERHMYTTYIYSYLRLHLGNEISTAHVSASYIPVLISTCTHDTSKIARVY